MRRDKLLFGTRAYNNVLAANLYAGDFGKIQNILDQIESEKERVDRKGGFASYCAQDEAEAKRQDSRSSRNDSTSDAIVSATTAADASTNVAIGDSGIDSDRSSVRGGVYGSDRGSSTGISDRQTSTTKVSGSAKTAKKAEPVFGLNVHTFIAIVTSPFFDIKPHHLAGALQQRRKGYVSSRIDKSF
jgi:hypothetical protein